MDDDDTSEKRDQGTFDKRLRRAVVAPRPSLIAGTQAEMPLDIPGQVELRPATPSKQERKIIQDVLIAEGMMAVALANQANSIPELQEILKSRLGQNSAETRRRYSQYLCYWYFPDGPQGLLPRVWQAYQDQAISSDLLRWSYLNQEPIIGRCVAEALFPCQNGLLIPSTYFDRFLQGQLGSAFTEKTSKRLKTNLKKIGFLDRGREGDRLVPVPTQKTSLLVLLHHLFACRAVRTVELKTVFSNPFWKYLGYKSENAVRDVFREADAAGLIGKYVLADQVEAVTTCFTLEQFLERKARL